MYSYEINLVNHSNITTEAFEWLNKVCQHAEQA